MNTQTLTLSEQAKQKRKEYYQEWRKKPENIEKAKKYLQKYWERKAQEENAS